MATAWALGAAVAGVLAFHAKLDVGHDLKALADRVATLDAKTEISGCLVQSLERRLDASEGGRALAVALGRDHLVHLGQGLRLIFPAHGRRVSARRLDGHVTLAQDLGTQFQQAPAQALQGRGAAVHDMLQAIPANRERPAPVCPDCGGRLRESDPQ